MTGKRSFGYYGPGSGPLRMRRRIEALERAVQRYQQRRTQERIHERALESMSDEELRSFVAWVRAVVGKETATEPGDEGWHAYQRALARERARSQAGNSGEGLTPRGGTHG